MLLGNSEHVADDRHRQPKRKILDQIHAALRERCVKRFIDDLLDARTHVLDPACGKGLHHQAAQARMVGRVLLQHPVAHAAEDRLLHDLRSVAPNGPLDKILAETLVAQHQAGLGVPARHECAELRHMHRIGGAHPRIIRIGIANEFRRQRVEKRLGRRGLNMLVHGNPRYVAALKGSAHGAHERSDRAQ